MRLGYCVYMLVFAVIALPIFVVPVFLNQEPVFQTVQGVYGPLCHQLTSRSYCYFPDTGTFEDCHETSDFSNSKSSIVEKQGKVVYKLPVCSRDIGLYLTALLAGIGVYFTKWKDQLMPPPAIWLILALVPMGIDGTGQLMGFWESTNMVRMITGIIAGMAVPFYMVPMLNTIFEKIKRK